MKHRILSEIEIVLFILQFSITTVAAIATEATHVVSDHALYLPLVAYIDQQTRPGAEATTVPPTATPTTPDYIEVVLIPNFHVHTAETGCIDDTDRVGARPCATTAMRYNSLQLRKQTQPSTQR